MESSVTTVQCPVKLWAMTIVEGVWIFVVATGNARRHAIAAARLKVRIRICTQGMARRSWDDRSSAERLEEIRQE
jgi:hypothetical protein